MHEQTGPFNENIRRVKGIGKGQGEEEEEKEEVVGATETENKAKQRQLTAQCLLLSIASMHFVCLFERTNRFLVYIYSHNIRFSYSRAVDSIVCVYTVQWTVDTNSWSEHDVSNEIMNYKIEF